MFWSGISDESGASVETQIKAHKELGWSHVELRKVNGEPLTGIDDDAFKRVHEQFQEAGMQCSCFASTVAKRLLSGPVDDCVKELRTAIPRMHAMGTQFIRIMSYINTENVSEVEWRKEAIARIRVLVKLAEDGGVTLVHENCTGWAGEGPQQTLDLLAEVNSPALKLVFDPGNAVMHKQDVWDYYTQVRDHIVYVHIKDAKRVDDETAVWSWPGEGDGCMKRILEDKLASGYDGGFSIEPHIAGVAAAEAGLTEATDDILHTSYVKYGRMAMALLGAD